MPLKTKKDQKRRFLPQMACSQFLFHPTVSTQTFHQGINVKVTHQKRLRASKFDHKVEVGVFNSRHCVGVGFILFPCHVIASKRRVSVSEGKKKYILKFIVGYLKFSVTFILLQQRKQQRRNYKKEHPSLPAVG